MINKLKIGFLVMALSFAMVGMMPAYAADVTYSADTTVDLSSPDINLTILSGSTATSVVVGTGTVVVVVPASGTFTITSADRALSGTGAAGFGVITTSCSSASLYTMTLTAPSSGAETITITPESYQCSATTGAGGTGGGTPADTTPPSNTSISINSGDSTVSSVSVSLTLAATDATQMIISNDSGFAGASWETYATNKSWTLTSGDGVKTVYAKFRDTALNMSTAVSDTITVSGTGVVAVVTNEPTEGCSGGNLYNTSTGALCVNNAGPEIPGCGNRTTGFSTSTGASCVGNRSTTATSTTYNFGTKTLKNGSKGEAVMELQRFLNTTMNLGLVVDGKLGPKTIAVIKKWQKANGLVADGLVGPKTKAKMNSMAQ